MGSLRPEDDGVGVEGIGKSLLVAAGESESESENLLADGGESSSTVLGT